MLTHKQFILITGILIVSLVVGIGLLAYSKYRCRLTDRRLCPVVGHLMKNVDTQAQGSIKKTTNATLQHIHWEQDRESVKAQVFNDKMQELFGAVRAKEFVYVHDIGHDVWLRQRTYDAQKYSYTLPFEPHTFFQALINEIKAEKLKLVNTTSLFCKKERCTRFELVQSANPGHKIILDMGERSTSLVGYTETEGEDLFEMDVTYEEQKIVMPSPIKEVKNGINMWLSVARYKPPEKKAFQYDFVREFQEEQEKDIQKK